MAWTKIVKKHAEKSLLILHPSCPIGFEEIQRGVPKGGRGANPSSNDLFLPGFYRNSGRAGDEIGPDIQ